MKRWSFVLPCLAVLLVAAGCSAVPDGGISSLDELRVAYESTVPAAECDVAITEEDWDPRGWASTDCGDATLVHAISEEKLQLHAGEIPGPALLGPNWMITGPRTELRRLERQLGGRVVN